MKIKTSELQGAALDWAVAKCEETRTGVWATTRPPPYSSDWSLAGRIIEREGINVRWCVREKGGRLSRWWAEISKVIVDPLTKKKRGEKIIALGTTPLIAAMRCYVASKLGDEVEIPEELK